MAAIVLKSTGEDEQEDILNYTSIQLHKFYVLVQKSEKEKTDQGAPCILKHFQ